MCISYHMTLASRYMCVISYLNECLISALSLHLTLLFSSPLLGSYPHARMRLNWLQLHLKQNTLRSFILSWTYVECSFHFLSRFAQENASVARHESARLPRPPLLFLLAQEPTLHTHTHTHRVNVREKGRSESTSLSHAGTAMRVYL